MRSLIAAIVLVTLAWVAVPALRSGENLFFRRQPDPDSRWLTSDVAGGLLTSNVELAATSRGDRSEKPAETAREHRAAAERHRAEARDLSKLAKSYHQTATRLSGKVARYYRQLAYYYERLAEYHRRTSVSHELLARELDHVFARCGPPVG